MIVVKHYLWISLITRKVTRFTIIQTTHILAFLIVVFLTHALLSTITCFYSSLVIFGIFTLAFFTSKVIYSLHLSLKYESLVYKLLSKKSIFFKLNITSNIIRSLNIVIMGKVNTFVFLIAWQRANHNLDLLFISHLIPNTPQFTNHVRHDCKMLPHHLILMLLVTIKFKG